MATWIKNINGSYWQISNIIQLSARQWNTLEDPAGDNKWYIWAQFSNGGIERFADNGVNLGPFPDYATCQSKLDAGIAQIGGSVS